LQDNYKMENTTKNNLYLTEDDSLQIASKCWERVVNVASKVQKNVDQIFQYLLWYCLLQI